MGIQVSQQLYIIHLLFVDDVLILCLGSARDFNTNFDILGLFSKAIGMEINSGKSTLSTDMLSDDEIQVYYGIFPYMLGRLDGGVEYLGFYLKPNDYQRHDQKQLLEKMKKRLKLWSHKWVFRAGRLVLVKAVLETIPVYQLSLKKSYFHSSHFKKKDDAIPMG